MKTYPAIDRIIYSRHGEWLRYAAQAMQIALWQASGRSFRTPHSYKQRLVRAYARLFHLDVFVETGTQYGCMLLAMQRHFKSLYSIELHPDLFAFCRKRLARYPHVHLLEGNSADELPNILERIECDALFWLDAHFFRYGLSGGSADDPCPLMAELEAILRHPYRGHVILVDDAHYFVQRSGYPALEEVRGLVHRIRPDLHWNNEGDVIRITPRAIGVTPPSSRIE